MGTEQCAAMVWLLKWWRGKEEEARWGINLKEKVVDKRLNLKEKVVDKRLNLKQEVVDERLNLKQEVVDEGLNLKQAVVDERLNLKQAVVDEGLNLKQEVVDEGADAAEHGNLHEPRRDNARDQLHHAVEHRLDWFGHHLDDSTECRHDLFHTIVLTELNDRIATCPTRLPLRRLFPLAYIVMACRSGGSFHWPI